MKQFVAVLLILIASIACARTPSAIPTGVWNYRLLVNGAPIGKATVSNKKEGTRYITSVEMEIDAGTVKNRTRQTVTETLDFRPISLEVYQYTSQNGQITEMTTKADYDGSVIRLDAGGKKSEVRIEKPFVFEGNFFMHSLIEKGFAPGTVVQHYIYEPLVDIEEPTMVLVKVVGKERISVNGRARELIHLGYTIENLKNIDEWIDERGISVKTVITMLNNRLELILED